MVMITRLDARDLPALKGIFEVIVSTKDEVDALTALGQLAVFFETVVRNCNDKLCPLLSKFCAQAISHLDLRRVLQTSCFHLSQHTHPVLY